MQSYNDNNHKQNQERQASAVWDTPLTYVKNRLLSYHNSCLWKTHIMNKNSNRSFIQQNLINLISSIINKSESSIKYI